ncbi:MAG: DNA mismatch repair endonuclease MutL [Verrucomicrobiae bacterium]|nr:DNA mismatch repair endonuclease MutL [Verrucomicrobiae bacterium]
MNRIRILPDTVANQIAAGEVVERPASAVKELVENSVDGQASQIRVEIKGGGKSLIRVTDNGHGMSRDDALLCIERHATSKIHDSADITSISTLGFRGEAIPSIASVSRFRLLSRESNAPVGVELDIHGGKLISVKEAGCAAGTQVEIRNLFYNLPARRKFLRSDATELGHVHHVFLLHTLARPAIGWTLIQEERVIHDLPAMPEASAPEKHPDALRRRIRSLYGNQLVEQLVPVDFQRDGVRLHGLIGKAGLSRSNRSEMYSFVNGRPVDSRAIYYGLIEGYHTALMRGRYPVCFLFLEIDAARVDVNIHPAKREVRFREDALVQGVVIEAARQALATKSSDRLVELPSASPLPTPDASSSRKPAAASPSPAYSQPFLAPGNQPSPAAATPSSPAPFSHPDSARPSPPAAPVSQPLGSEKPAGIQVLGVLDNLYIIAIDTEGLVIVDQHAAHERVLFEQVMKRMSQGAPLSQRLLLPQTVELSPRDASAIRQQLAVLEKIGIGIADFGDRSFIIDALPPWMTSRNIQELIRDVIDEVERAGHGISRERFAEELIARTVCRHAVKASDTLKTDELQHILDELQTCENPHTCPHGRPTLLRFTPAELEKRFGRREMGKEL